ncbi:MAG: hypothetical protein IT436_06725 [Phycisphaerales bacterium]|nr:hypothetical protein [Phycisphaerales bacterium]
MTTPTTSPDRAPPGRATPAWAALGFTFLNSVGTFVVTSGIFFLTRHGFKFSAVENYLLGVVLGATYIAGAMGAGPLIRCLKRALPALSSRGLLAAMMVAMSLLCAVPWLAAWAIPAREGATRPAPWPIWLLVLAYSPITGVLWPMVESYVSGGRRGHELRSTIGRWNVVWSSALIVSSVGVSRLVENHAALAMLSLGIIHIGAATLLRAFGPEPAAHESDEPHSVPESYPKLLVTFRMLLPMSYLVSSALLPFLPNVMERAGVAVGWSTTVAAVWLLARALSFYAFQRWGGWHGRWWPAIAGPASLLTGFGLAVLATHILAGPAAVVMVLTGLAMFGAGMAAVYSGALYYAMEVGQAEVDAGGAHEALIGVGYTAGPVCGLLAWLAVDRGIIGSGGFETTMLATVAAVCGLVVILVARRVHKHTVAARRAA